MSTTRKLWLGLAALLIASFSVLLWSGGEIFRAAPPMPEQVVSQRRPGRLHARRHRGGPPGLAIDRRHAARLDLGPRRLCRAGLERRLAASRSERRARPVGAARLQHAGLRAPVAPSSRPRCAARLQPVIAHATPTMPATRHDHAVGRSRDRAIGTCRRALRKPVRQRSGHGAAARRLCDARRHGRRRWSTARALTAFIFGGPRWAAVDQRAPGEQQSPTPTTGRTSRWSATRRRRQLLLWSVFSVLFLIAGIACSAGITRSATARRGSRMRSRRAIRSRCCASRRRCARPRNISGWCSRCSWRRSCSARSPRTTRSKASSSTASRSPTDPAVLAHAHLAHAARGAVDRDRVARHGPVHRAGDARAMSRSSSAWASTSCSSACSIIVVGAFAGQWLAVMQKLGLQCNFWFGHQGWEYVDLGRFWQIFLFVGLLLWLTLVGRALWPALRAQGIESQVDRRAAVRCPPSRSACSTAPALMWGEHTHLSMVEYWRWWVVHLWVEGFFEVFATAVIAFLFMRLGLVRATATATVTVLFATIVFMAGGVLGTLHHLYFAGTPTAVIALGASFSALEVVPLALHRLRGLPHLQARTGDAVDGALSLADPVLHRGGVLEPGRRRPVRLPDQSTALAVLHAGPEPHAAARSHGAVRRLRHARHRADAVLPARTEAGQSCGTSGCSRSRSGRSTSAWR